MTEGLYNDKEGYPKRLVICAAPDSYLEKAFSNLAITKDDLVLIKKKSYSGLNKNNKPYKVLFLKNKLSLKSFYLIWRLFIFRPSQIWLICGRGYEHNNIIKVFSFIHSFGISGNQEIFIYTSNSGWQKQFFPFQRTKYFPIYIYILLFVALSFCCVYWPNIILAMLLSEIIIRFSKELFTAKGVGSANVPVDIKRISKSDRSFLEYDSVLGWTNKSDIECLTTISLEGAKGTYNWSAKIDKGGRRNTGESKGEKGDMLVFGCSIIFGVGLDDEKTFAYKLQNYFSDYRVLNFGVSGYSTYQTLLKIDNELSYRKNVKCLVLGFHSLLEHRNTNPFKRILSHRVGFSLPSCISQNGKLIEHGLESFLHLPLSTKIKTIELLEYYLNKIRFYGRNGRSVKQNTTKHLLLSIQEKCKKKGIPLLVLCVDNSLSYYEFFMKGGFNWISTKINRMEPCWSLRPFDQHPNEAANEVYFEKVKDGITVILDGKKVSPKKTEVYEEIQGFKKESHDSYIYPLY